MQNRPSSTKIFADKPPSLQNVVYISYLKRYKVYIIYSIPVRIAARYNSPTNIYLPSNMVHISNSISYSIRTLYDSFDMIPYDTNIGIWATYDELGIYFVIIMPSQHYTNMMLYQAL